MKKKFRLEENKFSNTFDKIIDKENNFNVLPLTHKVTWYDAITILKDNKIVPTDCDVFENEKLIYLFYGIPSYVVAQNVHGRGDTSYFPVCFLLNGKKIDFVSCFPFDSGAFYLDMYEEYFHKNMNIYDFSISTDFSYISRFVSTFYLSNENYYRGICKDRSLLPSYDDFSDLNLSSYINLISKKGETKFDSRAYTIELISKMKLELKSNLVAIFIPRDMQYNEYMNKYKKEGIDIVTYNTFNNDPPYFYNAVIKEKVYQYMIDKNLF